MDGGGGMFQGDNGLGKRQYAFVWCVEEKAFDYNYKICISYHSYLRVVNFCLGVLPCVRETSIRRFTQPSIKKRNVIELFWVS